MRTIASERMRLGMSQTELADHLRVTRVTVSRWERGKNNPSAQMIASLSDLFGCSSDYLLGLSQERLPR